MEPNIQIATQTNLTLVVDEDITGPSFEQLKLMTVDQIPAADPCAEDERVSLDSLQGV